MHERAILSNANVKNVSIHRNIIKIRCVPCRRQMA